MRGLGVACGLAVYVTVMVWAGRGKPSGEGGLNRSTQTTKEKGLACLSDRLRPAMMDGLGEAFFNAPHPSPAHAIAARRCPVMVIPSRVLENSYRGTAAVFTMGTFYRERIAGPWLHDLIFRLPPPCL
jgi:hypothetical protein